MKEKLSLLSIMGIMITFTGSLIIAGGDMGKGSYILWGDALALLGAFCSSIYTLMGKRCRTEISTTVYTSCVYMFAWITLGIGMLIGRTPFVGYDRQDYLVALGMAICCTILGHTIFNWGLRYEKASFISIIKMLEPVFASILGILCFQEMPPLTSIAGEILVIGGIILSTLKRKDKGQRVKTPAR